MPFLGLATAGHLSSAQDSLSRQIGIAKELVQQLESQTSATIETISKDLVAMKLPESSTTAGGPIFTVLPSSAATDLLCFPFKGPGSASGPPMSVCFADAMAAASAGPNEAGAGAVTPGGMCWSFSGTDAVMCLMSARDNSRIYTALNAAM
jgi:hypothetical protein